MIALPHDSICLAYLSSAAEKQSAEKLSDIVAQAQRNNTAIGVTGLLCHFDGSFLQFLEGPRDAVSATFDRIKLDPRHHQVIEVHRHQISERIFGEWSMAVVRADEVSGAQRAFCRSLRDIELNADAAHRPALAGILTSFRRWLR